MPKKIYVSKQGSDYNEGTVDSPYLTIQRAADVAMPGDTVLVGGGEYRECVRPANGGRRYARIMYMPVPGEHAHIKGSETVTGWTPMGGAVWKKALGPSFFKGFNPFDEEINGDWLVGPMDPKAHLGDVYLNGKSLYEAGSLDEVREGKERTIGYSPFWTGHEERLLDPAGSRYKWHAVVGDGTTTIYANFQGYDPNEELVEINVRRSCFYPERNHLDYITVRGFEMSQAACPWAPPTADQPAMVGPNWAKGWIIEDCILHDAKCSAISIGKERSTGHNLKTRTHRKPGYQYQMEAVFLAYKQGWNKETIGSHIIRNNEIYDCGQNGVVGHLGCIFSEIYGNHIYNINVKHEFFGYEIAGIKLHAAIDVQICRNRIHDCTLGVWLDWEAQGTRISRNLFYQNDRDLMVEVTHGPHIVDNNLFLSKYAFDNIADGGAWLHNLILGTMRREPVLDRSTPYHFPHSTMPAGSTCVYGGDDRWYANIFVGGDSACTDQMKYGTIDYKDNPASLDEYIGLVASPDHDHDIYFATPDPVYIGRNAYLNGARSSGCEKEFHEGAQDPGVRLSIDGDDVYLEVDLPREVTDISGAVIRSHGLEPPRIVDQMYESPDGKEIIFDTDYLGKKRDDGAVIGPIASLQAGPNRVKVW
jgi:hypothetical protein